MGVEGNGQTDRLVEFLDVVGDAHFEVELGHVHVSERGDDFHLRGAGQPRGDVPVFLEGGDGSPYGFTSSWCGYGTRWYAGLRDVGAPHEIFEGVEYGTEELRTTGRTVAT